MFTPMKYNQSSHKAVNLGIEYHFPRHLASKTIAHRGPAKEVHFLRVVPLLPLLHTNKTMQAPFTFDDKVNCLWRHRRK